MSSLNPRRKVREIVLEPLTIWKIGTSAERMAKARQVLEDVGLDPDVAADRRPHQFSGGQCQRISIARALVLEPKLIICDEPVSALDVSVQAQVLNLLEDLKQRYGLTIMFIAHDLAVVKNVSDRVAVMYLGKLCEVAPSDALYAHPAHPYTDILLKSIPVPDPTVQTDLDSRIEGEIPSPVFPPSGCRFRTRCPRVQERCAVEEPLVRRGRARALRGVPLPAHRRCRTTGRHQRGDDVTVRTTVERPRTRLAREERRELLVDAAAQVFEGRDPGSVTFEEIADAAGVSRALVYNYFGDRQGLIEAVARRSSEQLSKRVTAALATTRGLREALPAAIRVSLEFALEDPDRVPLRSRVERTPLLPPALRRAAARHGTTVRGRRGLAAHRPRRAELAPGHGAALRRAWTSRPGPCHRGHRRVPGRRLRRSR